VIYTQLAADTALFAIWFMLRFKGTLILTGTDWQILPTLFVQMVARYLLPVARVTEMRIPPAEPHCYRATEFTFPCYIITPVRFHFAFVQGYCTTFLANQVLCFYYFFIFLLLFWIHLPIFLRLHVHSLSDLRNKGFYIWNISNKNILSLSTFLYHYKIEILALSTFHHFPYP